jgi:very-short-patch-repair endonuclease
MGEFVEDPPWSELAGDELTALVRAQHGVLARWQASRFLSDKAIRHRLETGRWQRAHRAVFRLYGGALTLRQRYWIAVLAATPGPSTWDAAPACLGGLSALELHGLRAITAPSVHLVVTGQRRPGAPAGVVVHRVRNLDEHERHPAAHPPSTSIGRAVVDAASWARSDDEARLIIAASFQQRLVSETEIHRVLDHAPNVRRRHLILCTSRDAAAGSHSLGELSLVAICRDARLPLPTRQMRRRDSRGRNRYLDAVFDPWRLVVEVDGAQHADVSQMWDDSARQNDLVLAGYAILRYPVHVVRGQPHVVARELRAALVAAGWRP